MSVTVDLKEYIETKIKHWQEQLVKLQTACKHSLKVRLSHGNTRNLHEMRYWTKYECPECGKVWEDAAVNRAEFDPMCR